MLLLQMFKRKVLNHVTTCGWNWKVKSLHLLQMCNFQTQDSSKLRCQLLKSCLFLVHDIQMERPMDSKTARALYIRQTKILQLPKSFRMLSNKELCLLEHVKAFQTREAKVCPHFVTVKREPEKKDCLPSQRLPKVASVDYLQNSFPILNAQFLQHEKQERESQFSSFFKKFRDSFDQVLQSGQNEEEDNLVSYCMEKCKTKFSPPESPVLQRQDLESEFPAVHGVAETRSTCKLTMSDDDASSIESKEADPFNKNRLHCWVLVSSNKRDVSESFFVEPSTGQRYTLLGSPYQAVEYIWNQHNIWINMQLNPGRSGLDMSWELKDPRKWERVLDSFLSAGDMQELLQMNNAKFISSGPITGKISEISTAVVAKGSVSALDTTGKIGEMDPHSTASKMEATILNGNRPNASMESNPELVSKSSLKTGIKSTSGGPFNERTNKNTSEADIHCGYMEPYHWLLPPSWIPLLEIPLETYVTRCPKGVKRTHFHQCTHELYSFYGDFVRWDGLIERIILYEDDDRTIVSEIHNYFQRRKDGLYKRIFIPALNKVHDFFNFGASFGLKETEIVDGQSRRFFFYENSRNDGLIRREEAIGRKMVESFANHEACLVYRCACYGPTMPPARDEHSPKAFSEMPLDSAMGIYTDSSIKGSFSHPGSVRLDGSGRPISHGRISVDSQKGRSRSRIMSHWQGRYELRKGAHPKDNVSKHVFKLNMDQIKVKYHHVDRHINASSRLYNKQGSLTLIQVDPFGAQLAAFDKLDEFHSLLVAEREAIKSVRDAEREIEDILQQRLKEEQNVVLITPYIDVACVKQEDLLQEGEDAIKLQTDFLSAFLPPGVRPRQKLSRQQMLEVRDSCLRALKDHLVNRATIIQARYDEETAALAKRRANFERDREQMTVEDEELYNQACENAFFRIQILELRAKQHEEEALKKYIEMERKLQHDPRLACLYRGSSN